MTPEPAVDRGPARVAIVHADEALAAAVAAAVARAGFAPWTASSARRALAAFHSALPARPVAAVVDVGLHDPYVFHFIDALRGLATEAVFVVTIGSVHNPSRYRRRPTSLHGADAHVDLPAVDVDLPRVLAPLPTGSASTIWDERLADWALDHCDEIGAAVAAGGDLASIGGSAGAALAALRARRADVEELAGALARMGAALVAARAAGRPFG